MVEISPSTKVSKNFKLQEFLDVSSKDVADAISFEPFFLYLVPWLQNIRDFVGVPVKLTCFYRNPEDNQAVGGEKNSAHLKGYAVDLTIPGLFDFPLEQKKLFKKVCLLHPDIRVGYYKATVKAQFFFHIDCGRIYEPKVYPVWQEVR